MKSSLLFKLKVNNQWCGGALDIAADSEEQFSSEAVETIKGFANLAYWSGMLHDIGKILVDKDILNKPFKLTDEEYKEKSR